MTSIHGYARWGSLAVLVLVPFVAACARRPTTPQTSAPPPITSEEKVARSVPGEGVAAARPEYLEGPGGVTLGPTAAVEDHPSVSGAEAGARRGAEAGAAVSGEPAAPRESAGASYGEGPGGTTQAPVPPGRESAAVRGTEPGAGAAGGAVATPGAPGAPGPPSAGELEAGARYSEGPGGVTHGPLAPSRESAAGEAKSAMAAEGARAPGAAAPEAVAGATQPGAVAEGRGAGAAQSGAAGRPEARPIPGPIAAAPPEPRAPEAARPGTPSVESTAPAPPGVVAPPAPAQPGAVAPAAPPGEAAPSTARAPEAELREFKPTEQLGDIFFDFDRYEIRPDDASKLDANAEWLRANGDYLVLVEGHCDERGTNEYNIALGDHRARATKNYLVAQGIAAGRITTFSYGEERPVCTDRTEECWVQNRRAHFLVKPGAR